jgi:signal transduction histidine kinase
MQRLLAATRYAYAGIAAALLVGAQIELALVDDLEHRPLVQLLALAAGLALLAQRRFTFWAPVAALVFLGALVTLAPAGTEDTATPFFMVVLSAWSFGAYSQARRALTGLGLTLILVAWVVSRFPDGSAGDLFWVSSFLIAAWLTGFALRHQASQMERFKALAAQLHEQLERRAAEAAEAERARIARELHDVVAHHVSVMTVQAGAVRRVLKPDQEREREALVSVEETGRQALTEMRRLLGVLKQEGEAPALAPQPGMETLEILLDQVREAGLPVELSVEGQPAKLPPGVDLSAYRIIQEALTNALKHAGPARAWVVVRYDEGNLILEVANDGDTATSANNDGGHGLVGMRERVAVYGGELESGPRPGGGYAVRARLPIGTEKR